MTTQKPRWAEAIKQRRVELGLSQEELALRADISPSLVTKIERGAHDIRKMKLENFSALLDALSWTPQEFVEATGVEVPGVGLSPSTETEQHSAEDIGGIMLQALKTTPEELEKAEQSLKELDEFLRYANDELRRKYEKTKEILRRVIKLGTTEGGG